MGPCREDPLPDLAAGVVRRGSRRVDRVIPVTDHTSARPRVDVVGGRAQPIRFHG